MMQGGHHIAHLNIARLRALPGDALVAEFVNAVPKVNALAERSPGFVWRWQDGATRVADDVPFEAVLPDPLLAVSLSVWERVEDLSHFVHQTLHGGFLRRKDQWFEPADGPAYVIWLIDTGQIPTVAQGQERMAHLALNGATDHAFTFAYHRKSAEKRDRYEQP